MTEKLKAVIMRWDAKPKTIKRWLQKEKNPVWAFHRMDLENAGDDLFEKKQFKKLIQQAKRNPETTSLATHLQGELTQYWITMKKDPGEIYRKFQLDEIQSKKDIFNKPEFAAWVNYADQLNFTLAVKKMDGTRNVANSVEDDVLRFWVKSGKTPDKTLVDLRLDKITSMDNPMWNP
ncbi:hypothetical protein F441_13172 [Phytophthora nicotianae CJ01A1]|uniref:RxLR effector protein n=1 Tax=Phytophthora nicotianae CJ01A1 TaxID=1317063 RepID=W2WLD7_PHYNI|nr:hypothetical protein F441_13172 [Phytophthora nicotianae CJ01A1]